jgi:hypothetical protein
LYEINEGKEIVTMEALSQQWALADAREEISLEKIVYYMV